MAWLHAAPELEDKERRRISRLREFEKYGIPYDMPDVKSCEYLLDWFMSCGMISQNSGGITALSWQEVDAFGRIMKLELTPWEAEVIMKMSRKYSAGLGEYTDPSDRPPYIADIEKYEADEKEKKKIMRELVLENRKG